MESPAEEAPETSRTRRAPDSASILVAIVAAVVGVGGGGGSFLSLSSKLDRQSESLVRLETRFEAVARIEAAGTANEARTRSLEDRVSRLEALNHGGGK